MTATRTRWTQGALIGLALVVLLALLPRPAGSAGIPASSGTDTSLPATDSQVTVAGRGPFAGLRVTVNQTAELVNQAISVTWSGGTPTPRASGMFTRDYLQIMQCWGDDDGSVPGNPGPPPEQCVQGATDGVFGGRLGLLFPGGGFELQRIVSSSSLADYATTPGYVDDVAPGSGFKWMPFRSVSGQSVNVQWDAGFSPTLGEGGDFWLNPLFDYVTTNEVPGAVTSADGTGAELFEVTTGLESSGLGCGQKVQPVPGGGTKIPKCWLVIVPRGDPELENAGTGRSDPGLVLTSPLGPQAWKNRIAVPLEFNPLESSCTVGVAERQVVGTELLAPAVTSWQPALCATPGLPPYSYGSVGDSSARRQLRSGAAGAPGMAVMSRPVRASSVDPENPVVYAPLTASGIVIAFNIERWVRAPGIGNVDPALIAEEDPFAGVRVADLNLTPRLVAKLLTQSYGSQLSIGAAPPYEWVRHNPTDLGRDPDFLQFNPEFALLQNGGRNFGGLLLTAQISDVARQVWEWVLADPEARAWLDGVPDAWGMTVNPAYATTASTNSTGVAFADPVPESFPKSDPYCYQGPAFFNPLAQISVVPRPLCGTDWFPYIGTLRESARATRAANDGAKTTPNLNSLTPEAAWKSDGPQIRGSTSIISLTDSPSALQYGVQMAKLSRAGDDGPTRRFIAPDTPSLTAGVEAMVPVDEPQVLEPDPTVDAATAYPLTALTYGAVMPLNLDAGAREQYASFIEYAAGDGQVPGLALGDLPRGYAPLPALLQVQSLVAAAVVRVLQPAAAPPEDPRSAADETPAEAPAPVVRAPTAPGPTPTETTTPVPTTTTTTVVKAPGKPVPTAAVPIAGSRFALPGLAGLTLASALVSLEITKRPRTARPDAVDPQGDRR